MFKKISLCLILFITLGLVLNLKLNVYASAFTRGSGTAKDPYQISTPEQLNAVRNNLNASYVLTKNIDLKSFSGWTPIGTYQDPFTGNFDGKNFVISNMKIGNKQFTDQLSKNTKQEEDVMVTTEYEEHTIVLGLFGKTQSIDNNASNIVNLHLNNATINIQSSINSNYLIYIGGLIGSSGSVIDNCSFKGKIKVDIKSEENLGFTYNSNLGVGGIIGRVIPETYSTIKGQVTNCKNYANINAKAKMISVGGIFASGGEVSHCYNYGNITATTLIGDSSAGGVCGSASFVEFCFNSGNVYLNDLFGYNGNLAGGICGDAVKIINSLNKGNINIIVTSTKDYDPVTEVYCGGIAGGATVALENCFNLGKEMLARITVKRDNKNVIEYSYAGRIVGSTRGEKGDVNAIIHLNENYSISNTLINKKIVTTEIGLDKYNGKSASSAEINKLLKDKGMAFLK